MATPLPGPARRALSATVRGVLFGALGGLLGALADYVMARGGAAQFLPDGSLRLLVFLAGLYGAAASAIGGAAGLLAWLLDGTDLGPLFRSGTGARPSDEDAATQQSATWLAWIAGGLGALALLGVAMRQVTLVSLARFHSPMLISALVGMAAAGLGFGALVFASAAASVLGPVLRVGPRVRAALGVPAGLVTTAWLIGLGAGGLGVARLVFALQQNPRMTPPVRAMNAALWAPVIVGLGLLAAHLLVARFGPRRSSERPARGLVAFAARPIGALVLPAALLAIGAVGVAAVAWPIVKLLPIPAAVTVGSAVLGGLGAVLLAGAVPVLRARAAALLLAPALLFALALQAGRADRVLKAASKHAALAPSLLDGLHAAWDLDRDGYSPLLGADCDDLDADVHPGAFDWPDDGIDQNCNGHDATANTPPRPAFPPVPPSVPARPNVILISIDALRADHVGCYGYARPTTPRIDELAKDSVLFKNGWAHSPSTRYSVPAILTGRYESTIAWGSDHWPPTVLPENRLLAEMFKDHAYKTAAILPAPYFAPREANMHMSMWGLDQGIDDYDNSLRHLHSHAGGDPARATGSSSREVGDLAVKWLDGAAKQTNPFFLWVHFYDPHYLYEKHPEVPDFGNDDQAVYDNEIRYTDLHIGRILDALKSTGAWDKSVVILTSDHGEGFGEHGVRQHGYHIYMQQNKVPFLVKVPGIAPRVVEEPVGHVDLFPTLLNLLHAPDEPQLLGTSFLDLLTGDPNARPRFVFQEVDYEGPTARKAVASRTHQLIANVVPDGTCEYYDLESDPNEDHDRFVRGAGGEQGRLFSALGEWMDEIALPANFKARVADNLSNTPLPSETKLDASLGGMLKIAGVTITPKQVRPGETAVVEMILSVPAKVPAGWRLFTHARAENGYFLNLDHEPVEGFVPMARLRPGQWVRDRIKINVPPSWPGNTVNVDVGLWKSGAGRAEAKGGGAAGDHVRVGTISVVR